MKILLVDDSDLIIRSTKSLLEGAGHTVVTRSNAFGTGPAILREKPDLVLLDVHMPGLDGGTIVEILLRDAPADRVPVILLHSDKEESELAQLAKDVGADGYVKNAAGAMALLVEIGKWSSRTAGGRRQKDEP